MMNSTIDPQVKNDAASRESTPMVILVIAGAIGASLFIVGLVLLYQWGDIVVKLLKEGEREGAWKVFVALAGIIIGLGVMFVGLQQVRSEVRRSPGIRRAVYGFNAVLTGLLLFAILIVVNVVAYLKLPGAIDATQSGRYTLADRTKQILAEIDRPTTVYLILNSQTDLFEEMQNLLANAQDVSRQITAIGVPPSSMSSDLRRLRSVFPQIAADPQGVLIVYGDEKPDNGSFIRATDLVSRDSSRGREDPQIKFLGEVKLANELSFLMGGKERPIVYFTQGHGEPDLNDSTRPNGLGAISERLQRRNFDIKPLKFAPLNPKVPDDAKILVVPGPERAFSPAEAEAIKNYLANKGKLVAMIDVPPAQADQKQIPSSGLESVLSEYGVDVSKERVLLIEGQMGQLVIQDGELCIVGLDKDARDTALGRPFLGEVFFRFDRARVIRPIPGGRNPTLRAQNFLSTLDGLPCWAEPDFTVSPRQITALMRRDPKEIEKRIKDEQIPVAVMVTETPMGNPMTGERPNPSPKLVAIGDATFVTNQSVGALVSRNFDLFASTLDWLRERPALIGVEPRVYHTYEMSPDVERRANQIVFLPLVFAMIGVLGLGAAVWLVRRQ